MHLRRHALLNMSSSVRSCLSFLRVGFTGVRLHAGVSARRPSNFFCFAKRSHQEKATRRWRSAARTALRCSVSRVSRRTRCAAVGRCAQTAARSQSTSALTRAPLEPCAPRRHPRDRAPDSARFASPNGTEMGMGMFAQQTTVLLCRAPLRGRRGAQGFGAARGARLNI